MILQTQIYCHRNIWKISVLNQMKNDFLNMIKKNRENTQKSTFYSKNGWQNCCSENHFGSMIEWMKIFMYYVIFRFVTTLSKNRLKITNFHDLFQTILHVLDKFVKFQDTILWFSKLFSFLNKNGQKKNILYGILFILISPKFCSGKSKNRGD